MQSTPPRPMAGSTIRPAPVAEGKTASKPGQITRMERTGGADNVVKGEQRSTI